jgi:hypothetical protein
VEVPLISLEITEIFDIASSQAQQSHEQGDEQ